MAYDYLGDYEFVAAGQSNQPLGATGQSGDVLENLIVRVATAATSNVSLKDGSDGAVEIVPPNTPIGVYDLWIHARSRTGAWQVTTGAGVSVMATGRFSK